MNNLIRRTTTQVAPQFVRAFNTQNRHGVFVGGLSWSTTVDSLRQHFSPYNAVNARIIQDRETGKSKGYGFVDFENLDDANNAINNLNQSGLNGRTIFVRTANRQSKPRDEF